MEIASAKTTIDTGSDMDIPLYSIVDARFRSFQLSEVRKLCLVISEAGKNFQVTITSIVSARMVEARAPMRAVQ